MRLRNSVTTTVGDNRRLRTIVRVAAGFVILIGLGVIIGWSINSDLLKRGLSDGVSMKPNAAFCFALTGLSLWLVSSRAGAEGSSDFGRKTAIVVAFASASVGLLTLLEYAADLDLGIDQLLFRDPPSVGSPFLPGRMSPYTAFSFLAADAVLLLESKTRHWKHGPATAGAIGSVITAISLLALGIHLSHGSFGLKWWGPAARAVHTCLGFIAIGSALIILSVTQLKLEWSLGRAATLAFIAALMLLLLINGMVHDAASEMLKSSSWAAHAQEVRFRNREVLVGLQSVQLGQRGYFITGRQTFLKEAEEGKARSLNSIALLRTLTADNPSQKGRIDQLEALFLQNLRIAGALEDLPRNDGGQSSVTVAETGNGLFLASKMQDLSESIDQEEARLAAERVAAAVRIYDRHFLLLPIGTFISLLMMSFVLFVLNRHAAERKLAERVLRESEERFRTTFENLLEGCQILDYDWRFLAVNRTAAIHGRKSTDEMINRRMMEVYPGIENTAMFATLSHCMATRTAIQIENEFVYADGQSTWFQLVIQPVPEGLFILSLDITARKRITEEIQSTNEDLERRVLLRTKELDSANQELEAFSYSVSHDLRAPLRGIDGFARVLREDYGAALDEEGQRILGIIGGETRRMGQLIDDLLRFSRVSRQPLQRAAVDMAYLAQNVVDELTRLAPAGATQVRMQALAEVFGDRAMLRQVWFNLIGNAVKFSARQEHPTIDIGSVIDGDNVVFHVRDNGVGFDDRYLAKLFNVFQRLHSEADFEGTGVGLALVSRIVGRHGGKVWAEGKPDLGATFYFSIPVSQPIDS